MSRDPQDAPRPSMGSGLVRPRLLHQLRAVESNGLALLVAPTGFGKTTLLEQWSRNREGVVRWCSPGHLPTPGALLKDGRRAGGPRAVVIDDVSDAADPDHRERLEHFVRGVAPTLPVVLAARRMPAFNLARHELARLTILTEHDLAFRPWEVASLFSDVYHDPLHPEEALTTTDRTAGWPAILRLWHLARLMGDREGPDGQPPTFGTLLRAYLEAQVLSALTGTGLRRLLRVSSAFDTVSAERVALLTGTDKSQRMLARIARRVDLVTVRTTVVEGAQYTCHPVLRNHLRAELLAELGPAGVRRLYDRAAEVAEHLGDLGEAFVARCRAGNAPAVASLLEGHGALVVPPASSTLEVLGPTLAAAHPVIGLARARLLLAEGLSQEAHGEAIRALPFLRGAEEAECRTLVAGAVAATPPLILAGSSAAVRSLRLLALGRAREARRILTEPTTPAAADDPARQLAVWALAALDALVDPVVPRPEHDRAYDEIARSGLGWLRRLAHVVALCRGGDPRRCASARALAGERERLGDAWGSVIIECVVALALMRRGHPDVALLERLGDRLRLLGCPSLEAWTRSALALAVSGADVPDSRAAASAEAFARATDAPGPQAVAYAAMGLADPVRREELLGLAHTTAQLAGMSARPWTWLRTDTRPGPSRLTQPLPAIPAAIPAAPPAQGPGREQRPWGGLGVTCFGAFTLQVGGRPASLAVRPVALTVLRILALHAGSPVHRDVFVEALWPDLPENAARHNLHVAVSTLRQGFEAMLRDQASALIARRGQEYVLAPGTDAISDLQRFDRSLAEATQARRSGDTPSQIAALHAALDLYTAEVLPGDGAAEWVLPRRDGYRLAAADAAARVAELELKRDHVEAAITAAQRAVQIDPCRDGSWRTLISAHLGAGQPAEAERARQEYAAVLHSLGVSTLPEGRPTGIRIA